MWARAAAILMLVPALALAAVAQTGEAPSPAEAILDRALAATVAIADRLEETASGALDAETADLRVRELRAAIDVHLLAWRGMEAEARIAARDSRAQSWEAAEARLAGALAAVAALPAPRFNAEGALAGPPGLADFAREPPIGAFAGVLEQGFETSAFYPADGGGPYWLEASADVWDALSRQPRIGAGRGERLLLALEVEGFVEAGGMDGYGHLGGYPGLIYVERILAARPASEDELAAAQAASAPGEHD